MRKTIDLDVLEALVNGVCSSLDSFSAYDVTKILREKLPNREIINEEVKVFVLAYVQANKLSTLDNGTYRIFTKQFKGVVPATNAVKVVFDGREPDVAVDTAKAASNVNKNLSSLDRAREMLKQFKNNVQPATQAKPVVPKLVQTRRCCLQSEGRLVLPHDLFNGLANKPAVINGTTKYVYPGQRFRTGLDSNVVDVRVYTDRFEIVPVK